MKKRNKFLNMMMAALAGVSVLSLSACKSSSAPENPGSSTQAATVSGTNAREDGKKTITWMTVRASWPAMDRVAEAYMEKNPDVKIEFERISDSSSYSQKAQILAASGELPELFDNPGTQMLTEIGNTGAVVDIDQLYEELNYTDRMLPIGLEWGRLPNGKLYEMAWENNVEYFWYNKNMFAAAGIEKKPETFDELLAVCQKLDSAGYVPVSVWPGWEVTRWLSFIPYRLTGNGLVDDLVSGEASMADEAGMRGMTFLQEIGQKYFQPGWATSDYTGALETFLSGNSAMYYIGAWQFASFLDENGEVKDEWDYFYMPSTAGAINGKTDMYANSGTGTCISSGKFDDTVKDFVEFVLAEYPDMAFWDFNVLPAATFDTSKGTFSSFWQQVIDDCNALTGYAKTWDVVFDSATVEVMYKEQTNLALGAITPEEFAKRLDESLAAYRNSQ